MRRNAWNGQHGECSMTLFVVTTVIEHVPMHNETFSVVHHPNTDSVHNPLGFGLNRPSKTIARLQVPLQMIIYVPCL